MIRIIDYAGLGVIAAAGVALAIWWWIDHMAEAAWRLSEQAWLARYGDVMTALRQGRHRKPAHLVRR